MLGLGQPLPPFDLAATVSSEFDNAFTRITHQDYAGKWLILFFWPRDFSFICPTEIAEFGQLNTAFLARGAQVLGASTDSELVHLAWRLQKPELSQLPFPMLADSQRQLSDALGIIEPTAGVAQRASYIIDPDRTIRFVTINDMSVRRNVPEILRILDALQTNELSSCHWPTAASLPSAA